jgi:hypothetical protein
VAPRADGPRRAGAKERPDRRTNQKSEQFLPPNRNQCYTVSCRRSKDRNMCGWLARKGEGYIAQTMGMAV